MIYRKTLTPAAASLTGFASNVTGATWTLTANDSGDSLAHQVSIRNDSATDHSAKTAILTGTDADGYPLTETINLPAGSATVESTEYFLTLTSAVPSATIGVDTMDIGWVDEFISPTIPLCPISGNQGMNFIVGGTINYTIQQTRDDVQTSTDRVFNWIDVSDTGVVGATASKISTFTQCPVAMRAKINSYSTGASLLIELTQSIR